jgi:membrane protein
MAERVTPGRESTERDRTGRDRTGRESTERGSAEPAAASRNGTPAAPDGTEETPSTPTELSRGSWRTAAKRTLAEYQEDNLQDRAAALTYFSVQSIFPGLLVLVSLLGLLGASLTKSLVDDLSKTVPGSVQTIITNALNHLQSNHSAAGILAVVGLAAGLWSASGYVAAFMRASNVIYDVPEGRPAWKTIPIRLGVTLAMLVLLVISVVIVVVTGGVARHVGDALGLGSVAVTTWDIAKWPVLLIIVSIMLAILYWASPNAKHGFRWVSPGGLLAVVLWLIGSAGFALYVAFFGNYNKVYGSLGAVIIFLVWMWLSNVAILLGAEFNAELERERAIAGGLPPDREPFSELRDDRKLRKAARKREAKERKAARRAARAGKADKSAEVDKETKQARS